jgi:predicted TIM-barrel fold metal-dependent hydrolase
MAERIIDAFPHIIPADCLERFSAVASGPALEFLRGLQGRPFLKSMWDLDARFRAMDAVPGYAQVLTMCLPPIEQIGTGQLAVDLARLSNDAMADLVRRYADRFVGFAASLPMEDPDASLVELDRSVSDLGALGVQVFTNVNGRALDDPRFDALWARLDELDLTVWVHGARSYVRPDYIGEEQSRYGLWASLGWPYEMAVFAARMVASGVLDRYPGLRFYLHHSAGMVPTFSRRVNGSWLELQAGAPDEEAAYRSLQRPVADYFREFYADTSGQAPVAIRAALDFFGPDHVMLGSDAPFGSLPDHLATIASLQLAPEHYTKLIASNAARVLRL